jgi:hypothetical protein
MTPDEHKARIKAAAEPWYDAARSGKDRPRRKSTVGTERQEQAKVVAWLRDRGILFAHVPNAGARNPAMVQSQGIEAGVPDLLIFDAPRGRSVAGAAIEMKRRSGGSVSMRQLEWIESLQARGWLVKVAAGAPDAIEWLERVGYGR